MKVFPLFSLSSVKIGISSLNVWQNSHMQPSYHVFFFRRFRITYLICLPLFFFPLKPSGFIFLLDSIFVGCMLLEMCPFLPPFSKHSSITFFWLLCKTFYMEALFCISRSHYESPFCTFHVYYRACSLVFRCDYVCVSLIKL